MAPCAACTCSRGSRWPPRSCSSPSTPEAGRPGEIDRQPGCARMALMSRHPPAVPLEFEDEFVTGLRSIFEEKILFNRVLGLQVVTLQPERVVGRIAMKPELVGHYVFNRLHGGVISAGLDAM